MAKNFVQPGTDIQLTAGATALVGGVPVLVGKRLAVPMADIPAYTTGAAAVVGVWRFPKAAVVLNQGDLVYWDAVANNITNVVGSNTLVGYVFETALAGSADVCIKINA